MKYKYILKRYYFDDSYKIYQIPKAIYFRHKSRIDNTASSIFEISGDIRIMTAAGSFVREYLAYKYLFYDKKAAIKIFTTFSPQDFLIDQSIY